MPRSLVLGNGSSLVGFDATYSVRDIYFPRVGDANHTMGNLCRTGFYIDRKFAWLDDGAWVRKFGYAEDSLVSDVTVAHPGLGISVRFEDYIDLARNWFIRNVEVVSPTGFNAGTVFFHYDWYIEGSDIGNTVLYDPRHRGVIAYKANRYFLIGGQSGDEYGVSSWANGKKGNNSAGTWVESANELVFTVVGLLVLAFGGRSARLAAGGALGTLGVFVGLTKFASLLDGVVLSALPVTATRAAVVLALAAGAAALTIAARCLIGGSAPAAVGRAPDSFWES